MFRALEVGSVIDLEPTCLVALARSTQTRNLALGRGPERPTRAYLMAFREPGDDAYRVFAFLARADRDHAGRPAGLLFRTDPARVAPDAFPELFADGEALAAEQGFSMEQVALEDLDPAARRALLAELPFVAGPPPPVHGPGADGAASLDAGVVQAQRVPTVSTDISLPEGRAVTALGRLLSLF